MNEDLQTAIETLLQKSPPTSLRKASEEMSHAYRTGQGSQSIFESESAKLAYLAVRMPATFAAISEVLRQLPIAPTSWLDLGAGPGTASWAAVTLFPESNSFTLIEKNSQAIALGQTLSASHPLLKDATWKCASLPLPLPKADAAIFSYTLSELKTPDLCIDQWLQSEVPWLIVVEPGTPRGFACIRAIREQILLNGKHLWAPCPHKKPCPLSGQDWCHFSARLQRSKIHRSIKTGEKGYEDEKYSYLIASRKEYAQPPHSKILRHPQKHSGHVKLSLCTPEGSFKEVTIGKSAPLYRAARKADWGDILVAKDPS